MTLEWVLDMPIQPSLLSLMQAAADMATVKEGISVPCSAGVRFCGDEEIQKLNASHRGTDRATDVLSFPSLAWPKGMTAGRDQKRIRQAYDPETGSCFLGDVVISLDHVRSQAEEYGHSESREAAYLLVHSLCHLMGYDHMEEEEKKNMREQEENILKAVGASREGTCSVTDEDLLSLAREAMTRSYSPYSHYPVGAALLASDGRVFQGCNIENASLGATICAERTALTKAISEGAREFDAIAIATCDRQGWPCGICRQCLSEFSPDLRIMITNQDGSFMKESTLKQILPHQFVLRT